MIRLPSRTRSVLTHFLMGTLLTSSISPSLYAMKGHLKNYDIGDWDSKTISDRGFSDIASDVGATPPNRITPSENIKPLEELKEFKPLFRRWFLELTPDVCNEGFLQYTELYEQSFERYNRGVFVKGWKSSDDMAILSEILHSFNAITKFKIEIEWADEQGDLSELILRTIPHYKDMGELHLSDCRLTHDHIDELLESLQKPEKLKILNLENNVFTLETEPLIRSRLQGLVELRMGTVDVSFSPTLKEASTAQQDEVLRAEREREQLELKRAHEELASRQREMEERERRIAFEQQQLETTARQETERKQQLAREQAALEKKQRELERQQKATLEVDEKRKADAIKASAEESKKLARERDALVSRQREMEQQQKDLEERQRKVTADQQQLEEAKRQALESDKKPPASDAKSDVPPPPPASVRPNVPPSSTAQPPSLPSSAMAASAASLVAIERPIPAIARGHEDVYRRFMNGRLVYNGPSGERTFSIAEVAGASLEGEFNLSGLMYTSGNKNYPVDANLRIKVGYRKKKENEEKVTVWLVPKFVVDASSGLFTSGSSFKSVSWSSDIGVFWTWGLGDLNSFDYLTSVQFDEISTKNLYDLATRPGARADVAGLGAHGVSGSVGWWGRDWRCFPLFLIKF